MTFQTYFVRDGLFNGEEGVYALTCGFGEQQSDGWYFIFDGDDDGTGPYSAKVLAERAGQRRESC